MGVCDGVGLLAAHVRAPDSGDGPGRVDAAHVEAFAFFARVPARLVPDNLKTGVDKPDPVGSTSDAVQAAHDLMPTTRREGQLSRPSKDIARSGDQFNRADQFSPGRRRLRLRYPRY